MNTTRNMHSWGSSKSRMIDRGVTRVKDCHGNKCGLPESMRL